MKLSDYKNQPILSTDYQKYKNLITPEAQENHNNNELNNINLE
jgi:hypothetical protein